MRKFALLLLASVCLYTANAQVAAAKKAGKKTKKETINRVGTWKRGGIFSLNVNQGGYDNWISAGDADWSIGANGYISLYANKAWAGKKKAKLKTWTNSLDINQAIQSIHDERTDINAFNKLDDRIDFLSKYGVELKNKIYFSTIFNARTQLYDTKIAGKRISGFFAPGVVTLAPGFEWKPSSAFSAFLSPISNRFVIVTNGPNSIAANLSQTKPYGVLPSRQVDWQPGAYLSLNLNADLDKAKKVNLKSRLDLYSNYANSPQNMDLFFTNILSMKVNKWISASVNLTMIYDDDVRQFGFLRNKPGLQYNHNIGVGVTRRF